MNFDYLKKFPSLSKLTGFCSDAEQLVYFRPYLSGMSARQALEYIVKLVYASKIAPTDGLTVFDMTDDQRFVDFIGDNLLINTIHYIRKMGNVAVHQGDLTSEEALNILENLHFLVGEIMLLFNKIEDYPQYVKPERKQKAPKPEKIDKPENIQPEPEVIAEFAQRMRKTIFSTAHGRDENENKKLFIRASLRESGWKIVNVPNQALPCSATLNCVIDDSGEMIDYILNGRDNKPLAVIEETETKKNPVLGRKKAVAVAEKLEQKYGYKPIVYYTDGYHIYCIDQLGFPVRRVFDFHTIDELELLKQRRSMRLDISSPVIDENITNRDYQKKAVCAVCKAFSDNRRRSLIVMATGTGKTRVSISCVDVLMKANRIKNVLFLADRTSLVKQAHKNFNKLLPNVTTSVYSGGSLNRDENARVIFSTYQTMIGLINDEKKQFGIGRFDLIIIDEAHRSIFKKYGAIFHYFDALMLGLTATPRSEENKSTYQVFALKNNEPDMAYELEQAIAEHYLVGFNVLDRTTEAMKRGIKYDDLTDEQKRQIEEEFTPEGEEWEFNGAEIEGRNIGRRVINLGTIDAMLGDLMKNGLKIDGGDKLGKTIIFASSHLEAVKIVERFNHLYKELGSNFCVLIDSHVDNSDNLIEQLEQRDSLPQIAVSVDMLDTGIDVPDILNLVFFKPIMSKIKFLQMIGRGTRLSPDVFGPGEDKKGFLIFDYFDNFRYFSTGGNWSDTSSTKKKSYETHSQTYNINKRKLSILKQLQEAKKRTTFENKYMAELHDYFVAELRSLNNDEVEVQYHMAYVSKYRTAENWDHITDVQQQEIEEHILALLHSEKAHMKVKSFDMLIYVVEDEYKRKIDEGKDPIKIRNGFVNVSNEITARMKELLKLKTIPAIVSNEQLLRDMMNCEYLYTNFSLEKTETVRKQLRDLMQYLPNIKRYFIIDIPDEISVDDVDPTEQPKPYPERALEYIANSNHPLLAKIRNLDELTDTEKEELTKIFYEKLGTETEFKTWSGNMALLPFLRLQVGIADEAIQTKFGTILNDESLDDIQRSYMQQIVEYAKKNGDITFMDLQKESPFCDYEIVELFGDKIILIKNLVNGIHKPIL